MIFDTHAHYNDKRFEEDRDGLLLSMHEKNVGLITEVSAQKEDFEKTRELIDKYDFMYGSIGVHPDEVFELTQDDIAVMEKYLSYPKMVAVGEAGLDYSRKEDMVPKEIQKEWFIRQIKLAKKVNKPIIVHSRDAAADTYDIMKMADAGETGGVVHCFSYSAEMAVKFIEMGFYIGIGGVVTFKNAKKLKEAAAVIPIEKIVLETDCPYLCPSPHRGERNDSSMIDYVAAEIASLRGITKEEVIAVTCENAKSLYRLGNI